MPELPPALPALIDACADARIELDAASDAEKRARDGYEAAEAKLFDALEGLNMMSVRTPRGLFSRNELAWAQVEDEAAARSWAEKFMPELLLLNRQRLSSLIREKIRDQDPMPDGVSFTTSRKITWRRS